MYELSKGNSLVISEADKARHHAAPHERWAKAPSPLRGPFVGLLLSISGLFFLFFGGLLVVVGGRLGLLWGVFWLPW